MNAMRQLVAIGVLCGVGACDPGWHIENPGTADRSVDMACVEAGVRAWSPKVNARRAIHGEYIELDAAAPTTPAFTMKVAWRQKTPNQIEIAAYEVGTAPPPGVLEQFRATRDAVAASVGASCNATITLGPEDCQRCK